MLYEKRLVELVLRRRESKDGGTGWVAVDVDYMALLGQQEALSSII